MIKLFQSKIVSTLGVVVLLAVSVSLGKEVYRKYQIQKEINAMQEEIKKLEGDNTDLNKMIEYFKSDAFLESEARKKLNLQKPEEKVVIFTDKVEKQTVTTETNTTSQFSSSSEEVVPTNQQRWWKYFFEN